MPLPKGQTSTIEDIYALPDGTRAELIDGPRYITWPHPVADTNRSLALYIARSLIILTESKVPVRSI